MRMTDPVNIYKEPPLGTTDAWDFAIAEPLGANRRGGVGPPSPHGGPAEHADALTLPLEVRKRQRSSQLRSATNGALLLVRAISDRRLGAGALPGAAVAYGTHINHSGAPV